MPTSNTIGIKNVEETLKEAQEYGERGFKVLKVKLGKDLSEDIERMVGERVAREPRAVLDEDRSLFLAVEGVQFRGAV